MVTEKIAKAVFSNTREHYESVHKSGNKKYDLDQSPWYKTWFGGPQHRNVQQPTAWNEVVNRRNAFPNLSAYMYGHLLYSARGPAANCGELACIACYLADLEGLSFAEIKIAKLTPPGDHQFCMIGPDQQVSALNGSTVEGLGTCPRSNIFVIDAWANIWCEYRWYPHFFETKMKKWLRDGKRVDWQGNWVEPHGNYSREFLRSQLVIEAIH